MKNINLYEVLRGKDSSDNSEKSALNRLNYGAAKFRNEEFTAFVEAYYYYRYFITNILANYLVREVKKQSKDANFSFLFTVEESKDGKFRVENYLDEAKMYIPSEDALRNLIGFLNDMAERSFFSISIKPSSTNVGYYICMPIKEMLNVYYGELQRMDTTDKLVSEINEEENTNVHEEELISKKGSR